MNLEDIILMKYAKEQLLYDMTYMKKILRDELKEAESGIAKRRRKWDDMSERRQSLSKWDEPVLEICGQAQIWWSIVPIANSIVLNVQIQLKGQRTVLSVLITK